MKQVSNFTKKVYIILFSLIASAGLYAQDDFDMSQIQIDTEKMLQEQAEGACLCIDSIQPGQSPEANSLAVKTCIEKQVDAYMLAMQLMDAMTNPQKGKKKNTIYINTNKNSAEYKSTYYKMESYLMDTCKSLQSLVRIDDTKSNNSMSKNSEAVDYYEEGVVLSDNGDYEAAIKEYEKALEIDSIFAFAWDNLGLCYRKTGKYEKAIECYARSIEIEPNGKVPYMNMGIAYVYLEEYEKAIECYENLKKLDENNPEIYYGIGTIYYQKLNNQELALQNICKAYNLYVAMNSAYRADAEKVIGGIYGIMKENGQEELFFKILKENNISVNDGSDKKKKKKK